jgi:hypothetical protein
MDLGFGKALVGRTGEGAGVDVASTIHVGV